MTDLETAITDRVRECSTPSRPVPTGLRSRLIRLPQVKAVAFDVGGTLFLAPGDRSIEDEAWLFQETLRSCGLALRDVSSQAVLQRIRAVEREMRMMRGGEGAFPEVDCAESYGMVLREVQSEGRLEGVWDGRLLPLILADFGSRRSPHWPMPDLQETLQNLRRRGIQLGIVSNAQHYRRYVFPALCGKSLDQMGFDEEIVLWSCDVGLSKPAHGIFLQLLRQLRQKCGIAPHETLFVGNDMLIDIRPAMQCGLHTALLAADRGSLRLHSGDQRLTTVRPDIVLTNLKQLLDVCSLTQN